MNVQARWTAFSTCLDIFVFGNLNHRMRIDQQSCISHLPFALLQTLCHTLLRTALCTLLSTLTCAFLSTFLSTLASVLHHTSLLILLTTLSRILLDILRHILLATLFGALLQTLERPVRLLLLRFHQRQAPLKGAQLTDTALLVCVQIAVILVFLVSSVWNLNTNKFCVF